MPRPPVEGERQADGADRGSTSDRREAAGTDVKPLAIAIGGPHLAVHP